METSDNIILTKPTKTCHLNVSAHCAQTGPYRMFKWSTVCFQCDLERSRMFARKWNEINYQKRKLLPKPIKPKPKRTKKLNKRKYYVIKMDPLICDNISTFVSFE